MANRYGEAALMAARQAASAAINPVAQWESAMEKLYPTSPAARKQNSARSAFLGLCEEGLVKGIPAGHYAASKENKAYAVQAAALLSEGTQRWSTSTLWQAVTHDPAKAHNHQMDIVMALWKNGLIVSKA
ncbi:MAG: DUF6979 family protein [Acidobacteriaceae bacterium]